MKNRTILSRILLSDEEPRPRVGWRLMAQFALMVSLIFVLGLLLILANLSGAAYSLSLLINQLGIFVAVTASVPLARRFIDRRSVTSLGLHPRRAIADLAVGFAIAGVIMGAIFLFEGWIGWLEIDSFGWQNRSQAEWLAELGIWLAIFIVTGWHEELLARGYWLQNIAEAWDLGWGLFVSSALFALGHLFNPNVSWAALLGLFAAGYFLAYGYLRTRQLWLPIGLHIGWNYFEGTVFGFTVSGLDSPETFRLIETTVSGPPLWTGGNFGPEAGLIVLPAMLLGVGLMYLYTLGRRTPGNASEPSGSAHKDDSLANSRNPG